MKMLLWKTEGNLEILNVDAYNGLRRFRLLTHDPRHAGVRCHGHAGYPVEICLACFAVSGIDVAILILNLYAEIRYIRYIIRYSNILLYILRYIVNRTSDFSFSSSACLAKIIGPPCHAKSFSPFNFVTR